MHQTRVQAAVIVILGFFEDKIFWVKAITEFIKVFLPRLTAFFA